MYNSTYTTHTKVDEWYLLNIAALRKFFDDVSHCKNFSWIFIKDYGLPITFNQKHSNLLLTTPKQELTRYDGFSFFFDQKLQRIDGKPTGRFHDFDGYNPYSNQGFSRLSFHVYQFRPDLANPVNGDTILDMCHSLFNFLADERGVV